MKRLATFGILALVGVAWLSFRSAAAKPLPAGQDAPVWTRLKEARARGPLLFSNAPDGGPDRFELLLTIVLPFKGGGTLATNYVVARDKDDVAVLVLSASGAPYAYVTKGLFAGFDQADLGTLVLHDRGAPSLSVGVEPASNQFVLDLSYKAKAERADVRLDFDSVILAAAAKVERATLDDARHLIKVSTAKSVVGVFLPTDESVTGAPLRGLVMKSENGLAVAVSNIRTTDRSAILGLDKAAFEKLGIPTRFAADGRAAVVPLVVPAGFGSNEKEKEGIKRLVALLPNARYDPVITPEEPLSSEPPPGGAGGEKGSEK